MVDEIKVVKLDELKTDERNANKGTERGRYMLDHSLRQYGAGRSILVDKNGRVIAGNKTLETAVDIGMDNVIVVQSDGSQLVAVQRTDLDLDDGDRARLMAYADNRASEVGLEWDAEQIAVDLGAGVDLSALFKDDELIDLGALTPVVPEDPGAQLDRADELQEKWQVQRGQIWEIPSKSVQGAVHRLMCGDSTKAEDVARVMQGEKTTAVLTDPPYGQNQPGVPGDDPADLSRLLTATVANLPCTDAVIVAFQSPRTFPVWLDIIRAAGHKFERMLWLYKQAQEVYPWRGWLLKSEAILVSSVGNPVWHEHHPCAHDCYVLSEVSNEIHDGDSKKHPGPMWHGSIKPLVVVSDIVQRICLPGSTVFDPFCGSGTTHIACELTKRIASGVELEPTCVSLCLQRMAGMGLEPRRVGEIGQP